MRWKLDLIVGCLGIRRELIDLETVSLLEQPWNDGLYSFSGENDIPAAVMSAGPASYAFLRQPNRGISHLPALNSAISFSDECLDTLIRSFFQWLFIWRMETWSFNEAKLGYGMEVGWTLEASTPELDDVIIEDARV